MYTNTDLELQCFYPAELEVADVVSTDNEIMIQMFSRSKSCACPKCGIRSEHRHGTYKRKIQDLPILLKGTRLLVNAHEYQCDNPNCDATTFAETMNGFLSPHSRMTERCADFICSLAAETNCESCSRICKQMNLQISGDSVIRLLTKRYQQQEKAVCGSVIGIDDFAFKKGQTYGTIIVDEATHKTVAILDGRDGTTLKEWLAQNRHVKTITRDRASAYASAIQEVLPEAMQIADRFHLHHNLMEAIKSAMKAVVPVNISIPVGDEPSSQQSEQSETEGCKKKAL